MVKTGHFNFGLTAPRQAPMFSIGDSEWAGHYDIEISDIEVLPDHIHLLAGAPPRIAVSEIAQVLKSTSTKCLFEKYPWLKGYYWGGEIWVEGYFVRSVGSGLTRERIARYIREQSSER